MERVFEIINLFTPLLIHEDIKIRVVAQFMITQFLILAEKYQYKWKKVELPKTIIAKSIDDIFLYYY